MEFKIGLLYGLLLGLFLAPSFVSSEDEVVPEVAEFENVQNDQAQFVPNFDDLINKMGGQQKPQAGSYSFSTSYGTKSAPSISGGYGGGIKTVGGGAGGYGGGEFGSGSGGYSSGGGYGVKTSQQHMTNTNEISLDDLFSQMGQGQANVNVGIKTSGGGGGGGGGYGIKSQQHGYAFGKNKNFKKAGCMTPPSAPNHATMQCSTASNSCKATCANEYKFPNGNSNLYILCVDNEWTIKDSEWDEIPSCEPICSPKCQNNGICVAPGQCECPDNFLGPQCQHEKKLCLQKPNTPSNSRISCTPSQCTISCAKGYRFPDGSTVTNMVCKEGDWRPSKEDWSTVPNCQPVCFPNCQNGGNCLSFNVCQCPPEFRGPQCQYGVENCSPKKMKFNGGYNCSGAGDSISCSLYCPPGVSFDKPPAPKYTCNYKDSKFLPANIPQCVFGEGVQVSQTFSSGYSMSGGGVKGHGFNYNSFGQMDKYAATPGIYSMYIYSELEMSMRQPKKGICMTWNGNKVKTFDGLIYTSSLYCSHTLFHDKVDGIFSVILRNCPYGEVNCNPALVVFLSNIKYTFENDKGVIKFYTIKAQLPIPSQMPGIKVQLMGSDLKIDLEQIQTSITWDSDKFITIEAAPSVWNRTAGLCGTFDSDLSNDFASQDGSVHASPRTFVDSWQAPNVDLDASKCIMGDDQEYDEQKCNPEVLQKAKTICEKLVKNKKLQVCTQKFNSEMLMRSCLADYCFCHDKKEPKKCACRGISVLAKDCISTLNINFENGWRDMEICPITCANGRIYKGCGPQLEESCGQAVLFQTKDPKCTEGCFCPDGLVQFEGKCIDKSDCPCRLKGKNFKTGSTVTKDCNTCTCDNGNWKCTDQTCGSRCGAIGDPHYVTFDGRRYDFMGKCSYYLVKTDNLTIISENVPCSGTISEEMGLNVPSFDKPSCTKSVTIEYSLNGTPTKIELMQGRKVAVNGAPFWQLPRELSNGLVKIRHASSSFVMVHFQDGFKIWWDGMTRVYVDAPPSYRGKTSGLCGTFNSNSQDDFLTPEGDIESVAEPFADKWKTKEVCSVPKSASITHPCQLNPENKNKAEEYCAKLKTKVFEDCHWQVDPQTFYEDCLYDVCACKGKLETCLCPILSAYSSECALHGVILNWRHAVNQCAIKCPAGQVYEECGDSCTLSCQDLNSETLCKTQCIEGCRCPDGQVLDDKNECVPKTLCPCTFKGITFKPGHKEVRPANKFLELCTCSGGKWLCNEALDGDDQRYPPAADQKSKCLTSNNEEFTTCEPTEPKTCKNMHYYEPSTPSECHPGCVCKKGYVFDMVLKKCVLPKDCSCHHGGRSYNDGDKIQEDCNSCVCKSGKWSCTTLQCSSVCSSWGDSHFTTFDGKDFDFQGVCNYVLAKGDLSNGKAFSVVIQNVLCGSMGETCSKSVKVSISNQSFTEILDLNEDILLPGSKTYYNSKSELSNKMKLMNVYRAGIFLIVQVPHLDLQIEWDRGTRVYLKLNNQWRGQTKGLCGNYNGDSQDDMKNPTNGLEISPNLFGDSWKLQDNCAKTQQQSDSCAKHPERSAWAHKKCGIMHSSVFEKCYSEVPVENYYKGCIHDACACDQGGDCECLCTALAAYAAACSRKGVPIRWRTPDLCPMQCDPQCSNYNPCISKCPVETCDTVVENCVEDGCVEGCKLKQCPEGMVYANESYSECVPRAICKPICKEIDGKKYFEGDIVKTDACHTCRCTRNNVNCIGKPCPAEDYVKATTQSIIRTTTTTPRPFIPHQEEDLKCKSGWSEWLNQDQELSGNVKTGYTKTAPKKQLKDGDKEPLPSYFILRNFNGGACPIENMTKVECRTVNSHLDPKSTGQDVECSLDRGLLCRGPCHDYEIRVYCDCGSKTRKQPPKPEKLSTICDPTIPHVEYPGDCYKFKHCQPTSNGSWTYAIKTCGPTMMYNPLSMTCDHIANVQAMKPECGAAEEQKFIIPDNEIPQVFVEEKCPPGQMWTDCAVPCRKACHYYGKLLVKNGLCKHSSDECEPGCVDKQFRGCKQGLLWRDQNTCVSLADCTCISNTGELVKPGQVIHESDCESCQCLDNSYVCDKSACVKKPVIDLGEIKVVTPSKPPVFILPSTVAPPPKCLKELVPLLSGDSPLPDSAFEASSILSDSYKPHNARINAKPTEKSAGAWAPLENEDMQYIQVKFPQPTPIFGILIQGSPIMDMYVTMYKIMYSLDGTTFSFVKDLSDRIEFFYGPIDSRTPIESVFQIPIEAKIVRLYPIAWHEGIAIRWELLGCGTHKKPIVLPPVTKPPLSPFTQAPQIFTKPPIKLTTTTPKPVTQVEVFKKPTTPKIIDLVTLPVCDDPMGVENGKISPPQVKVSSMKNKNAKPLDVLKLTSKTGWIPNLSSPNEFVLFDFLEKRNLTGVKTKGGDHGYVTAYNVFYSTDNKFWNPVTDTDQSTRVFRGNADDLNEKVNYFKNLIQAQYLKIVPTKWHDDIEMKIEPVGCFKPYPVIETPKEVITEKPLEQMQGDCGVCPGVQDMQYNKEVSKVCKCYPPLFWTGQECTPRSQCPCMVGYTPYEVGAHYETDDCQECVCVLGGVPKCKDKECPKCEPGLRANKKKGCQCVCEECPPGEVMCKTSSVCIPTEAWCNGVEDCPDDEVDCKPLKPTIETIYNVTKTCPTPFCKPGFLVKVINDKPPPQSVMFDQQQQQQHQEFPSFKKNPYFAKQKQKNNIAMMARFGGDDPFETFLPPPPPQQVYTKIKKQKYYDDEEKCIEFICIPDAPIVVKNDTTIIPKCASPKCPPGYNLIVGKVTNPKVCPTYDCEPERQMDAICNVTGRTFNTFDNVEFKYDICSHVLARDVTSGNWSIVLSKNCAADKMSCKKELEIIDKPAGMLIKFSQDLKVDFNGYKYTVEQLQKSPLATTFVVSKIGDTIVFVSHLHGFWVKYNNFGDVEIGVSQKYSFTVDGLCGYFNGIPDDDKRLPNGQPAKSTMEFGDSWKMPDRSLEECEPHVCPKQIQEQAWEMCNSIRHESFGPCGKSVDIDKFVSRCIETACECLKESTSSAPAGTKTAPTKTSSSSISNSKTCKCAILQKFATDCMAADDTVHLDMWRSIHGCEISCPLPFVHKDCYRRRCEYSCDNMELDSCPYLPGQCFSGCYCPDGMVRQGSTCVVAAQECRDCVCDNVGRTEFKTYDGKNFTFDGNCTYLMSRDIVIPGKPNFQIYASFDDCHLNQKGSKMDLSCAKKLFILSGQNLLKITLEDDYNLQLSLAGKKLENFPVIEKWVKVERDLTDVLTITLLDSFVKIGNVKAHNGDILFSVTVPGLKYGNKMEGLCGNCNRLKEDDLVLNPKQKKTVEFPTIKEIAESWLADEKLLNLEETMCFSKEQEKLECKNLSPDNDLCFKIMNENLFGQCHFVVDPIQFVSQCQKDTCLTKDNKKSACQALEAYAKKCSQNSICVDWRKDGMCPFNCPTETQYDSCGCPETCESLKQKQANIKSTKRPVMMDVCSVTPVEGCFCPKDKVLRNGKCIPVRECSPCDDMGHFVGDVWHPDKCTTCECTQDEKTVCSKQSCSETVCSKGMKPMEQASDGCCKKVICVEEPKKQSQIECPKPNTPVCTESQVKKLDYDVNKCPKYICECKPPSECPKSTIDKSKLKTGEKIVVDKAGCCPVEKKICDELLCPKKIEKCQETFYEPQKKDKKYDECCDSYQCIPPKDKCIVEIEGKKVLKAFGNSWPTENPCLKKVCTIDGTGKPTVKDDIETCLVTTCKPGFKLEIAKGSCCGKCVQTNCILGDRVYKTGDSWKEKDNNCTTYRCSEKNNQFYIESESELCPEIFDCPDHLRYFKGCCQFCKPEMIAEDQKNCMPLAMSEADTVQMIKKIVPVHGICTNKIAIPKFMECYGTCNSGTKFNKVSGSFEKKCDCCSIQQLTNIPVELTCLDNYKLKLEVAVPKVCGCTACAGESQQQQQKVEQQTHIKDSQQKKLDNTKIY